MQLLNTKGKLLISNCCKSEEDSSLPLMWFGFKKKKKKKVAVSAYYKPDFRGCNCSTKAFLSGVGNCCVDQLAK